MLRRRDFLKVSLGLTVAGCQRPATTKGKALRFAVASDGHYGQAKTDFRTYHEAIVKNLKKERMEKGLDFVVFNGDLFHDDVTFLPEVKQIFDSLGFPYYVTRGNHDHASPEQWRQTWGYDLNHSVEIGRSAILLGDTSNIKGEYLCPDIPWIDRQLAGLTQKENVFLFLHIPSKMWSAHGTDCPELEKTLTKYPNLKAMFHGHDHAIDVGKTTSKPAFFDGHFGGNWGVDYRGYRIVETRPEGQCYTYQFNPETQAKINEQIF
ncbi:MAG: metallophosphoesterase [Spirosomataceae bacterium]